MQNVCIRLHDRIQNLWHELRRVNSPQARNACKRAALHASVSRSVGSGLGPGQDPRRCQQVSILILRRICQVTTQSPVRMHEYTHLLQALPALPADRTPSSAAEALSAAELHAC